MFIQIMFANVNFAQQRKKLEIVFNAFEGIIFFNTHCVPQIFGINNDIENYASRWYINEKAIYLEIISKKSQCYSYIFNEIFMMSAVYIHPYFVLSVY